MANKDDKNFTKAATELRRQAEDRLIENVLSSKSPRPEIDALTILHELEVHQIELESQNAELRQSQAKLEVARNKYIELFDFAPVGYFAFDFRGVIREVNFCGAKLLGQERGRLVNRPFNDFIADDRGREIFSCYFESVLHEEGIHRAEINVTGVDHVVIPGQFKSVKVDPSDGVAGYVLTSIMDGTEHKHLEEVVVMANDALEYIVESQGHELDATQARLKAEIAVRMATEGSLAGAFSEIKRLTARLKAENTYLHQAVASEHNFGEIIGQSEIIKRVFLLIDQVAPMNATVLLLGETGTGKGVVARAIHGASSRKDRPMVTVNCTSLPANLIESELFGREKGAFTGANVRQIGRFELADGGTIFLDEIGELPLELQCKLLRVIQDGEFERLGSPRTIKTDVRIIAATNRNLEDEIRAGRFREDLFYRLNVFPIVIPPLRQRQEDIPLLVNHFVAKFNKKVGKKIESVPKETLSILQGYHWPGNVREVESVIERAVITSPGSSLQVQDRFDMVAKPAETVGKEVKVLAELEHDHILQVLLKTSWRIEGKNGAALLLGLNPSTLRARMRKFGIVRH